MADTVSFFLGANTPYGFVSFFDELYNPYGDDRALIIKGGPGTGKSGIIKAIASVSEAKGYFTERIYCSSDPKSLDGVIVPELKLSASDGTSPHAVEPVFPGASEKIINTGDYWNDSELYSKREDIRRLTLENSLHHRRSTAYLSAAGKLKEENIRLLSPHIRGITFVDFRPAASPRPVPESVQIRPPSIICLFPESCKRKFPVFATLPRYQAAATSSSFRVRKVKKNPMM